MIDQMVINEYSVTRIGKTDIEKASSFAEHNHIYDESFTLTTFSRTRRQTIVTNCYCFLFAAACSTTARLMFTDMI